MGDFPNLSVRQREILKMLVANGEMYGLEMVNVSGRLKRGSIYVILNRMENKGLIESRKQEVAPGAAGAARRVYKVTGHGSRVLGALEVAMRAFESLEWRGGGG